MSLAVGSSPASSSAIPTGYNVSSITDLGASQLAKGNDIKETPSKIGEFMSSKPVLSQIYTGYKALSARRNALGLPYPGTVENVNKEVVKDTFLTNYSFTGLRAEIGKSFGIAPLFQVTHSLSIGNGGGNATKPYSFGAYYATDDVFLHGVLDQDGGLSGRFHHRTTSNLISKLTLQLVSSQPAMVQIEEDFVGPDFSLGIKFWNPSILGSIPSAANPSANPANALSSSSISGSGSSTSTSTSTSSPVIFTGVAVGSFLQSVTPHLALGFEAMYSRINAMMPAEAAVSYVAKYAANDWIASAQLQPQGIITSSFWRKVTDKVEAGVECQLSLAGPLPSSAAANPEALMMGGAGGPPVTREGLTTVGAKYDFRTSSFRGMIDSAGKVSCVLDRRVAPFLGIQFSGEIDHAKATSKVGLGLQLEFGSDDVLPLGPDGQPLEPKSVQPPM